MNVLTRNVINIINKCFIPHVSLKHIHLFRFGLITISLPNFQSLNSNARVWGGVDKRSTAESKMYRLLKNEMIRNIFLTILKELELVTPESIINIDFSTFAGGWSHPEFQVLAFGLQTYIGRAIPIFFDIIRYPIIKEGSQNIFIIEAIKKFKNIFGFYPVFVFDRGFTIPSLIIFLITKGIVFYIRSKSGKTVRIISMREYQNIDQVDHLIKARQIKEKDTTVKVYGKPMRLVISDLDGKDKEPWYILTSDFSSPRKKILETYYYRFEIEETFKDLKHLRNLKHIQVKTEKSFRTTLWFMILGCWLAYFVQIIQEKTKQTVTTIHQTVKINSHKTLSFFRSFFEAIQRCFYRIHAYLTRKSRFR
ncbi:MAG: hypothetical protein EPN88_12275 [Bacteroidetes bacterium]|nr:MAG: hypothetical protein EPN88_12275 [Bacteroidota bacterium]